jgi:hypothetical protein
MPTRRPAETGLRGCTERVELQMPMDQLISSDTAWYAWMVPADGTGPNVYRSGLSGWLLCEEGEEASGKLKPTTIMVGPLTPVHRGSCF